MPALGHNATHGKTHRVPQKYFARELKSRSLCKPKEIEEFHWHLDCLY